MIPKLFTFLVLISFSLKGLLSQETWQLPEAIETEIQARIENEIYPGLVIGIIHEEGRRYFSYGVKSYKSRERVDQNSIFEIGSISKTFTGILLADAVQNGELSLNTPLQELLPEGISAPERNGVKIQMVHLSNHTSSLPRLPENLAPANPANPYADYTAEQMFQFLDGYELARDIGSQYEYSNLAVGLLGHVLAARKGLSYEALLKQVILDPLGMKETAIVFTPSMQRNLALPHSQGSEVENWDIPTLAGAGGIRSSITDMMTYLAANMGLKESDLSSAMQLSHTTTREAEANPQIGLGWHLSQTANDEIIWHNGGTGGYRTFAGFLREENRGIIVMANSDVSVDDIGLHALDPNSPLQIMKPSIRVPIQKTIDMEGIEAGLVLYKKLKEEESDSYNFGQFELNKLGYHYLQNDQLDKALAVFKLNIEAFPDASNPYDSMGEGLLKAGDTANAITNYEKSVELNPGNTEGIAVLKKLGVDTEKLTSELEIDSEVLQKHVGKYELAPGFVLAITLNGKQLEAQATGQAKLKIFPKSETAFYLKVVNAQLVFNRNEAGETISVTLFQAGQEVEGKKIE